MNAVENRAGYNVTYILLGIAAFSALFPIALMLLNSVKSAPEIVQNPLAMPQEFLWDNFVRAWRDAGFTQAFFNSAVLSITSIVLVCATGSMTAYVLARRKVKRWRLITGYLLATSTAPIQLYLFPLYFGFATFGLINNVFAVALIYCAIFSPFSIMLMRTYFLAIPRELEEAAVIDGANSWQVFRQVMLPIVWPGILTVALIVGLYTWNEFLIATTFLPREQARTAIVSFFLLSGQYVTDWGQLMAGATMIVLPVVVLFVFLQRHFIEGMTGGSVKG
ncbi:carbohydrate ABC transporter permease [Bauldia sp.]|uniref:carbohydrate ABC transporter permease n=1 Tax=Bauldia sp. TaxID=2575872 RepID=UPI003BA9280E